jgi:hypothetical protein
MPHENIRVDRLRNFNRGCITFPRLIAYPVKKTGGMVRQVSKVKVANPQGRNSGRFRRPIDMR